MCLRGLNTTAPYSHPEPTLSRIGIPRDNYVCVSIGVRLLFTLNVQRCIGYGHSARFYPCNLPCNPCMSPPYRTPSPLSFATRERLTRHPSARNEEYMYTSAPRGTPSLLLRARETIQVWTEYGAMHLDCWLVGWSEGVGSVGRSVDRSSGWLLCNLSLSLFPRPSRRPVSN